MREGLTIIGISITTIAAIFALYFFTRQGPNPEAFRYDQRAAMLSDGSVIYIQSTRTGSFGFRDKFAYKITPFDSSYARSIVDQYEALLSRVRQDSLSVRAVAHVDSASHQ